MQSRNNIPPGVCNIQHPLRRETVSVADHGIVFGLTLPQRHSLECLCLLLSSMHSSNLNLLTKTVREKSFAMLQFWKMTALRFHACTYIAIINRTESANQVQHLRHKFNVPSAFFKNKFIPFPFDTRPPSSSRAIIKIFRFSAH